MPSKTQKSSSSNSHPPPGEENRDYCLPPESLQARLNAMSDVLVTQRARAWYQSSWVPITIATVLVSIFGFALLNKLTQDARTNSKLAFCEQFLSMLSASAKSEPAAAYAAHLIAELPLQQPALAQAEVLQIRKQTQENSSKPPSKQHSSFCQLTLKSNRFFANHGAPSYFCQSHLSSGNWKLRHCKVIQLGEEKISIRYYNDDNLKSVQVYTMKRDALCKESLSLLKKFDQQQKDSRLVKSPCSVSLIVSN